MVDKTAVNAPEDFSEALAGLESEQFHDGEAYRRDDNGNILKGDDLHDERVGDREEEAADREDTSRKDGEKDEDDDGLGDDDDANEEGEEGDEEGDDDANEDGEGKKPLSQTAKLTQALRAVRQELREMKAERAAEKAAATRSAAIPKNRDGSEMTPDQYAKASLEADENAPQKPDPSKFKLGEFDNAYRDAYDDYLEARRDYLADKRDEFAEKFATANPNAAPVADVQEFGKKIETFIGKPENKKVKGFDAAVEAAKKDEWPLPPVVAELILDSDVGAEITVFLHQNPKVAKEIADLPPVKQAARFGKLEDKVTAEKEAKKRAAHRPSSAPAPIGSSRGAGNAAPKGYSSENFDDVERRWNSDSRKRAGR